MIDAAIALLCLTLSLHAAWHAHNWGRAIFFTGSAIFFAVALIGMEANQ